jgi:hypothetical protein
MLGFKIHAPFDVGSDQEIFKQKFSSIHQFVFVLLNNCYNYDKNAKLIHEKVDILSRFLDFLGDDSKADGTLVSGKGKEKSGIIETLKTIVNNGLT